MSLFRSSMEWKGVSWIGVGGVDWNDIDINTGCCLSDCDCFFGL